MTVAITGLPVTAGPGVSLSGNVVCTNNSATAATGPLCAATVGGVSVISGACTPALPLAAGVTLAAGASISCPITVAMPGNPADSNVVPTNVLVNGTTGATNDGNGGITAGGNNSTSATINIIDAVNDNLGPISSTTGGTTPSVLTNDQVGTSTATTAAPANVTLTPNGAQGFTGTGAPSTLTLNPDGTITVPANATPGSYTVPYQICANPATTPVACDTAVATVVVSGAPALQVTKTAGVPTVALGSDPNKTDAGDTVSYSFALKNTGNVALTNVTISDPKLPALACTPVATLAAGATVAVTGCTGNVYTLTAADVAAGSTTNVATATGTPPNGPPVTGTGTATVPSTPNGGITVTKLANPGVLPAAGGVISYTILVENTGKTALSNVTVTDPVAGTVNCGGSNVIASLAVGASATCTASYTVTPADVTAGSKTNVATATGTAPPSSCATPPCTVSGSGTTTVTAASSVPEIKVVKKASPTTAATVGQVIDYTIVGSNTGNVTLTNVTISDTKIPALSCVPVAPATLAVGQTITCTGSYTLTAADAANASVTNIATGTGTPPSGPPVTGTGTATTPVVPIANDDTDSTSLNQPVTTPVSPNDAYPPGSTVTTGGTSTRGGTVTCSSATPATCTYQPPLGFVGTDTYSYTLCLPAPNGSVCDTAIVTVTVGSGPTLSGNVFDDGNGLTDSVVNGAGTNAGGLTAYLVNPITGAVVASAPVSAAGTYSFLNVASGTYTVVISATPGQLNNPTSNLPSNWVNTGEGLNPAGDGVVDGRILNVVVTTTAISGINFGIEQRPIAGGSTVATQVNPGGTISIPVPASAFQTGTSDADGVVSSYLITAFPSAVTSITINGTTYTVAGGSGTTPFPAGGVVVPAANIGNVLVDPVDGIANVQIPFTVTDNAGVISANIGSANIPFGLGVADLAVQKNGPAVVQAGGTLIYTITLINNGLSAADGTTFSDTLPAGLTGVTATCTGTSGTGTSTCALIVITTTSSSISGNVPRFPSGGSVVITVRATAPATGPLVNTVTITPPPGVSDPVPSNNTSTVTTSVGTPPTDADISVVKTGAAAVAVSGTVSYVIDVVNAGPGSANGAVFTDTVPAGITGVNWTCTASGQAVCPAASGTGNTISQTLTNMPMNGRLRYLIIGTAPASATSLTNTATIAPPPGVTDPNPGNNSSTVTTVVTATPPAIANLSMSKVGSATVTPGGAVRYTLVATNNGPASANGATVTDTFPNVLTGASWTCTASAGASCGAASGSGNLNLTLPTFAAGSQVTITVNGTAPSFGTFQNSARVTAPPTVTDPDPTDNIGGPVITTVVLPPADLVTTVTIAPATCPGNASRNVTKVSDMQKCPPGSVAPGEPVIATVVMGNVGPSPAGNAIVTLQLPPGSTNVVVSGGGVYDAVTQLVTWPVIAFVPANTMPVVTYTVSFVPPASGGTIRSDVRTPDVEVTLANNPASATLSVVVAPPAAPIPTAPWWAIALLLAALAGRSLRRSTGALNERLGA